MQNYHRVLIDCSDETGLVHKISGLFFQHNLNMISNNEFVDRENNKFFMRSEISGDVDGDMLEDELLSILPDNAIVKVIAPHKKRVVLMATKESHALGDILIRYDSGELDCEIIAVVSNYDLLEPLVSKFNIPYFTISHDGCDRDEHEKLVVAKLAELGEIDYIVLAKYMRILTPYFVSHYEQKIINIHHSFLPAFIGANPYKQAYERGVKIIGATAHFVNNDLDEGPIISQDVIGVNHAHDWIEMRNQGRDVEKIVLSRALKMALDDRIFVYKNKTIIF